MGAPTAQYLVLSKATQVAVPTVGQTVTAVSGKDLTLVINPAGTLLTLTLALPSNPVDGQPLLLCATQIVTTLTISGGTLLTALTALAVGLKTLYVYSASLDKWV